MRNLEATVNAVDCDLEPVATAIDLSGLIAMEKPQLRIGYSLEDQGDALAQALGRAVLVTSQDRSA